MKMLDNSYHCQSCGAVIPLADVNVSSDIALCRACGNTMPFSGLVPISDSSVDLQHPPKGVRIVEDILQGKSIIYRRFSPFLLFLIPFSTVWSGLTFAVYGTQIRAGRFDLDKSLLGLPLLIMTVCLLSLTIFLLLGRWRISVNRDQLAVAAGVGPIGWTRRLACDRSARVSIKRSSKWMVGRSNVPESQIQVDCQGNILKFGTMLPEEVKNFIAELIRRTLAGS